jgi:4-amino-4-deoxy-L-arabinose transferase-like glycosyltransferase
MSEPAMQTAMTPTDAADVGAPQATVAPRALRWVRGGLTAAVGTLLAFLLMANDGQLRWGVPMGALCIAVASWGIMDLLLTFDDPDDRVAKSLTLREFAPALGRVAGGIVLFGGSLALAQCGAVNQWFCGFLVTLSFLLWVAAVFDCGVILGPWAVDETGKARGLLRRHGFWVLVAGAGLYLPTLGIFSLWDPWETHYGEVARGILARDDWVSLWWSYQGWFWSKPILDFWIQAIAMATLGTGYQSDKMLIGWGGAPIAHPEWVVRAPNVLFTFIAMYFLYKGVAMVFGRRAGLIGALVLATMPDWYFLAHQSMTDMPCIAALTTAMGLVLIGIHTNDTQLARVYEVKVGKTAWRLSAWHLVFGAILVTALPQILYLISRNLELVLHGSGPKGFRPHWDEFTGGSKGDCGIPGNETCALTEPASLPKTVLAHPDTFGGGVHRLFGAFEPVLQGLVWSVGLGLVLYLNWAERRVRRLMYLAAWYFAAVATMAKGPMGLAIPAAATLLWICTKRRWSELIRLEIPTGLLISLVLVGPWCVASYVRHGTQFTDELFFHDMFNRAFEHVHDTNEGDDTSIRFYIWQLGYALFPWTGLAALGLLFGFKRTGSKEGSKGDVSIFLFSWFLLAFALVSFMGTKFHHYIFPAVPPIAMLLGIALDEMLTKRKVAGDAKASHEQLMMGAGAFAAAVVTLLVGRDLILKPAGADQPGAIRFLQLFTYNYKRAWPETLDFSTMLTVLTVAGAVGALGLVYWKWRDRAVYVFGGVALVSAIWGLDVYMMKTSPHWGQHETIQAYYEARDNPDEWLVAYQMNWKGENFYTGNHLPVFVSSGGPFTTWLKGQREKGAKVMFFITEHSRVGSLKNEVKAKSYREITDKTLDNKFVVVRAEL